MQRVNSYGYMGQLLKVDLTRQEIASQPLDTKIARNYLGGSGLGARLLYDLTQGSTDPFEPKNPLIFLTGPLVGTRIPTSGRHALISKSPLTDAWGEADSGGEFGVMLKSTGYDGLIITGKSAEPVYLWVNDEGVEIRDASQHWGEDTYKVSEHLKDVTHPKASIAAIGLAGERLSRIAAVINDGRHARASGRTGLGAVMGSKLLKAVVAYGTHPIQVYDPKGLQETIKHLAPLIQEKTKRVHDYGTAGAVVSAASIGDMPAKNWTVGDWVENAEKISGQTMASTILTGRYYCRSCIIGCGREIEIKDGKYAGVKGAGPEYEGLAGLGSMIMLDDLEAISYANELCNQYGLDVMSAGSCIAFAMEAYERGILTQADTGGIDLVWGNPDTVIKMIHAIGRREGLGWLLGEGIRRAVQKIGGGSQELDLEVKGLELAFHDPRSLSSLAANYATHPRGADHRGNSHQLERYAIPELGYDKPLERQMDQGKGVAAAKAQDYFGLYNSLKLCQLIGPAVKPSEIVEWINLVTGWDMNLEEFLICGERASNLKRMYNYRCGMTRKDDTLPNRILTEKFSLGGAKGYVPHLGLMLAEYYEHRGWNAEGIPLPETLTRLGLVDEIQDLQSYLKV